MKKIIVTLSEDELDSICEGESIIWHNECFDIEVRLETQEDIE